jgi:hypothetical protein
MNLHSADIASRLSRYLNRRQAPRRLEGKPQAETDEIRALSAAVQRHAPRSADHLAAWWPAFEASLGEISTGGLWPTEREIKDAAASSRQALPKSAGATAETDHYQIAAARMEAGQPVGEGWLYGREACELIRRGLVTREVMTAYRSGAFLARRKMYGEPAALAWEAEAKERHEAAKAVTLDPTPHVGPVPAIAANRMVEAAQ